MSRRRPRSEVLYELTRPVPRPQVVIQNPNLPLSTSAYPNNVEGRFIPVRIVPNPDFVRQIYRNFCNFCEQHPERGTDPDRLGGLRAARRICAGRVLASEAAGVTFLDRQVFPAVRNALEDLEQNPGVECEPQVYQPEIAARADFVWHDNGAARVIWQQKSPQAGAYFFRLMVNRARNPTPFCRWATNFEGVDSIIVKVGSFFYT
jgi:hypothetical protein